jgi:bifunctional non-homologous end joining protein LigD
MKKPVLSKTRSKGGLAVYRSKRKFKATPEPKGKKPAKRSKEYHFVIQKHAASHLHYDFRLEMDGVLKSWAVPKGIPTERAEKRLAMRVEDHPLDYANFEGTIPAGNYGAGTVMVWDRGSYEVASGDPMKELEKGKIELHLAGKKLKSDWTLVRMRQTQEGPKEAWLLIKSGESIPAFSARTLDRSVLSAKSMKGIAKAKGRVWISNHE